MMDWFGHCVLDGIFVSQGVWDLEYLDFGLVSDLELSI